jgi:glycosyltransferase involved in cell wall biosynthesis
VNPRVSIVLAAYNRSAVMRCAIESVLRQTIADWELLVIGDACTDDSEAVSRSFGDARITFTNLPENHGEQSAANNAGIALAHATVVAFLNQDDMWFPDHLERTLAFIDESGAGMAFTLAARVRPNGLELLGVAPSGRFSRYVFAPASTTVWRRSLLERVGPWRDYRELRRHPTQDLMLRAHRLHADMRCYAHVTVLALPAGLRPGSYRMTGAAEHEDYLERMREPDRMRTELLERIALTYAEPSLHASGIHLGARAAIRFARDVATLAGIDVWSLEAAARYGPRPGSMVENRRRIKVAPEETKRP